MTLRLYKVDDGGVMYWVVAHRAEDCVGLIAKCEQLDPEEEWDWGTDPPTVTHVGDSEAARTRLIGDDDSRHETMLDGFRAATTPGVLACSEWP